MGNSAETQNLQGGNGMRMRSPQFQGGGGSRMWQGQQGRMGGGYGMRGPGSMGGGGRNTGLPRQQRNPNNRAAPELAADPGAGGVKQLQPAQPNWNPQGVASITDPNYGKPLNQYQQPGQSDYRQLQPTAWQQWMKPQPMFTPPGGRPEDYDYR